MLKLNLFHTYSLHAVIIGMSGALIYDGRAYLGSLINHVLSLKIGWSVHGVVFKNRYGPPYSLSQSGLPGIFETKLSLKVQSGNRMFLSSK